MKYDDEYQKVFNSELAVKVLRVIAIQEKGDYGSSIAQSLDRSQASISRVLSDLHNIGFVNKGERRKAQYYDVDYQSIGEVWYSFVYQKMKESDEEIQRRKWMVDEYTDKETVVEGLENNREKIVETVSEYAKLVFEGPSSLHNLKVSQIFFLQFGLSIGHNMINRPGFLERNPYLEYPKDALIHLWNLEGFSQELNQVVEGGEEEKSMMVVKKT